jgi:hypothetical protein
MCGMLIGHTSFFIVKKLTLYDVLEVSTLLHQTCLDAALHFFSASSYCAVSLPHLVFNALSLCIPFVGFVTE